MYDPAALDCIICNGRPSINSTHSILFSTSSTFHSTDDVQCTASEYMPHISLVCLYKCIIIQARNWTAILQCTYFPMGLPLNFPSNDVLFALKCGHIAMSFLFCLNVPKTKASENTILLISFHKKIPNGSGWVGGGSEGGVAKNKTFPTYLLNISVTILSYVWPCSRVQSCAS